MSDSSAIDIVIAAAQGKPLDVETHVSNILANKVMGVIHAKREAMAHAMFNAPVADEAEDETETEETEEAEDEDENS